MATSLSSSSSSSSSSSIAPSSPSRHHPPFTPIQECESEGNEYEDSQEPTSSRPTPSDYSSADKTDPNYVHRPTPLHHSSSKPTTAAGKSSAKKKRMESDELAVSCNKCRPSVREKFSVVPLDNSVGSSPNGLFKSIFSSFVKKSPRSSTDAPPTTAAKEEAQWKVAVAELSHKLIQATKKRDEAIMESSRLKYSMAELEKKLNKLEIYCHSLKSDLENCTNKPQLQQVPKHQPIKVGDHDKVIERFLVAVSESRSSVRQLSRSLTVHLRQTGGKVYERLTLLLQPHDIKISLSTNPKSLLLYLEALLNKAFFEDFECIGFRKNGSNSNHTLNPIQRCESNFKSSTRLKELTWEEVLNKGTKQFSEEFSKFCDRKMSEIVSMLGWSRAWPEPLLQAFFLASKAVWLVHLLAYSVHPSLPIFRVDKGVRFDPIYMEDMGGGDKARKLVSMPVRVMVEPGFYIYGNVVKCKVICRYQNNNGIINSNADENGLNL